MDLGLEGRKAIVTGASRGIGRAIAEELAREGADLAICAREEAGLEVAARELESLGSTVFRRPVDVGIGADLRAFVVEAGEELGGLDVLVQNPTAGSGADDEGWQASFETDLMGSVRSVDAAMPLLSQSDAAAVIFIGSTAAVENLVGPVSYPAIKAALIVHANGLSQALASEGIRVNVVSPGPIYFEGWAVGSDPPGGPGHVRAGVGDVSHKVGWAPPRRSRERWRSWLVRQPA